MRIETIPSKGYPYGTSKKPRTHLRFQVEDGSTMDITVTYDPSHRNPWRIKGWNFEVEVRRHFTDPIVVADPGRA